MKNFSFIFLLFSLASPGAAQTVELIAITLRESNDDYIASHVFSKNAATAKRAEVNLSAELDKFISQGYGNHNAFVLFYNYVQAIGCEREYVIQTVKLTKKFYDWDEHIHQEKNEYLVEVMKLNQKKITKKPDQHLKRYALGNVYRRDLLATYEVGCGTIPEIVDGIPWPYKPSKNYRRLQDYSEFPGLYNRVKFDFSISYSLGISFDADGKLIVQLPDFLIRKRIIDEVVG